MKLEVRSLKLEALCFLQTSDFRLHTWLRRKLFDSVTSISLSLKPNAATRLAPAHLPAAVQTFARAGQGVAPAAADRCGAAEELGLGDAGIGRSPRGSGVAQGRNRRQRRRGDGAGGACASAGNRGRNRRGLSGGAREGPRGPSQGCVGLAGTLV